jgi:hypothetical protein
MPHRGEAGMSHSSSALSVESGMGWVEMSERELRRAEVLASVMGG